MAGAVHALHASQVHAEAEEEVLRLQGEALTLSPKP